MANKKSGLAGSTRPKYEIMLQGYLGEGSVSKDVIDSVFDENVDKLAIAFLIENKNNTCALRVSDALNKSGWLVPSIGGRKGEVRSWFGSITKHRYVLGSTQLADLLHNSWGYKPPNDRRFGPSDLNSSGNSFPPEFGKLLALAGKKGVIFFKFEPVSGYVGKVSSGHITLWNGTKSVYDSGNNINGPFNDEAAKKIGLNRYVKEIWFFELP